MRLWSTLGALLISSAALKTCTRYSRRIPHKIKKAPVLQSGMADHLAAQASKPL